MRRSSYTVDSQNSKRQYFFRWPPVVPNDMLDLALIFPIFVALPWTLSSVGLEHYLDRVGVTGSNPVASTAIKKSPTVMPGLFVCEFFDVLIIAGVKTSAIPPVVQL